MHTFVLIVLFDPALPFYRLKPACPLSAVVAEAFSFVF